MSPLTRFAVPIAVVLTVLGYVALYFGVIRYLEPIANIIKGQRLNMKHYTMNVDLQIGESSFQETPDAERESLLKRVDRILQERIEHTDAEVTQIVIDPHMGTISYTISNVTDTNAIQWLLSTQGKFGFYRTYECSEVLGYFATANEKLRAYIKSPVAKTEEVSQPDSNLSTGEKLFGKQPEADPAAELTAVDYPLWAVLYPNVSSTGTSVGEGPMVGMSQLKDTAKVNEFLSYPEVKSLFPHDLKLMWGALPYGAENNIMQLYAIRQPSDEAEPPVTNRHVKSAEADEVTHESVTMPKVNLSMTEEGAAKWERMTKEASRAIVNEQHVKKCIAIVMDNRVYSAPRVQQEITGGKSEITGIDNMEEARNLAAIIKAGELEVPVFIRKVRTE